ncbi:hypothetical protein SNE40_022031 [Patella caerulea]|uniref:Uncharacterized protein n=1 Tax=Patella caerulea TaxID=87958 RepID=A0AAN8G8T5_PATCE
MVTTEDTTTLSNEKTSPGDNTSPVVTTGAVTTSPNEITTPDDTTTSIVTTAAATTSPNEITSPDDATNPIVTTTGAVTTSLNEITSRDIPTASMVSSPNDTSTSLNESITTVASKGTTNNNLGTTQSEISSTEKDETTILPKEITSPSDTNTPLNDTLDTTQSTISITGMASSTEVNATINATLLFPTTEIPNCGCLCADIRILNETTEMMQTRLDFLLKDLDLDYEKLSATIRKYKSIEDDRPSVVYIGGSALVIICIFFALIVLPDVMDLCRFVYGLKNKRVGDG